MKQNTTLTSITMTPKVLKNWKYTEIDSCLFFLEEIKVKERNKM